MKSIIFCFVVVLAFVAVVGCDRDLPVEPAPTTDQAAAEVNAAQCAEDLAKLADWEIDDDAVLPARDDKDGGLCLFSFRREVITGNIVHYSVRVPVGYGPHDVIGLHRIVKERRPGQPIRSQKSILFQHGCCKDFVGVFQPSLTSPSTPDGFGIAAYLAEHDIDVWGIDQAWTLVPLHDDDAQFMAGWGLARQIRDLRTAVAIARATRLLTGNGHAKLILAGYSNGIPTTIGLINEETQLPPGRRDIGGYIPFDMAIKTDSGAMHDNLAYYSELYHSLHQDGFYDEPVFFAPLADLVRCCPDDPCPYSPDLTNRQYALVVSTTPSPGETFHYWAGTFDDDGMPSGLRFITPARWLDFLGTGVPYEPIIWTAEWTGYVAGTLNTPYDDHLAEIRVPVLDVTPLGGVSAAGTAYGLSLLGSTDVQTLEPAMGLPILEEFAHIDLFTYEGADELVWRPVLDWIVAHTPGGP